MLYFFSLNDNYHCQSAAILLLYHQQAPDSFHVLSSCLSGIYIILVKTLDTVALEKT